MTSTVSNVAGPAAALVRAVSPTLADAQLTSVDRQPIDVEVARDQHAAYIELLTRMGLRIEWLPAAPAHPDAVFVEDTVVVVGHLAVITRPGAASRRAEVGSVRPVVAAFGLTIAAIEEPGTLDGGDVLQIGDTVHVGRSTRTNDTAIEQLTALLEAFGRRVVPVGVGAALHLKSAATALPDGAVLAERGCVDIEAFAVREVVAAPEAAGANVLTVGDTVVVSAAAPQTAGLIRARGLTVHTVDITELEKAEAGPTCLSVLLPTPGRHPA